MGRFDRSSLIGALFLIALGALLLVFNLLPDLTFKNAWPVIFFVLAGVFALPPFIWPDAKRGLAGLLIPGAILFVIGLVFLYNTFSGDWAAWAYAWLIIPVGIGLGLLLAGHVGEWGPGVTETGIWLMIGNGAAFGLFATLFGGPFLKATGAGMLLAGGALLLLRAFRRGAQEPEEA